MRMCVLAEGDLPLPSLTMMGWKLGAAMVSGKDFGRVLFVRLLMIMSIDLVRGIQKE